MSEISVELNAVTTALNKCRTVQTGLQSESAKMIRQCESLGSEWNDEKYRELSQIVHRCSEALRQPLSELKRCETFLIQLSKIISEYENVHFSSNGTTNIPSSSNTQQYRSIRHGSNVSIRRHERMSRASARNIDYAHERSLRYYCSDGFSDINGYLRGNSTSEHTLEYTSIIQENINNITETLNERQLGRNMVLYRGVDNPAFMIGRDWQNMTVEELNAANVGRVFQDDGFCSTSVDPAGAGDFSQTFTGATMIIQAPADANGMFMGEYNNRSSEREVLLQRGSSFRIDGITRDNFGNCTIRATLIGRGLI